MSTYREFQAKTVDQAIEDACRFFDVQRDALEIDIVRGGSAGIFGLGAKKACIRARRRRPSGQEEVVEIVAETLSLPPEPSESAVEAVDILEDASVFDEDDEDDHRVAVVLSAEDRARLEETIRSIMTTLLKPIGGDIRFSVDTGMDPILVHIEDDEYSGLIIGRDGQTITALQYLANRIVSKAWPNSPRIQLDAGDYRQKQQEQLQSIALFLSQKAKKSGRVQSTRPLSSFHRRVVHMALQDDHGVQTRSKGEGPMKRVLILPVKRRSGGRPYKRQDSVSQACQS